MCPAFSETRSRILQEISDVCKSSRSNIDFQLIANNPISLTQFILDPTSFNLTERIHVCDPIVNQLFKIFSRHVLCGS